MPDVPGSNDPSAGFEELLLPVLEPGYRTALRLTGNDADAQDLIQDASLLALRGFGSFRPGSNFKAWFFRILFNRFYSGYRSRRRRGVPVEITEAPEAHLHERAQAAGILDEPDVAASVMDRIGVEAITEAIDQLPDDFREVSLLYFTQDLQYQEIAQVLDLPIGTVRSRLHRARKVLQHALFDLALERGLVSPAGGAA